MEIDTETRNIGRTLELPRRPSKPRRFGLTAVTDLGIPVGELAQVLPAYHPFLDIAKLGIGSAYIEPCLEEKIKLYRRFNIPVYFGGTLFEKYYIQGKFDDYLRFIRHLGIDWIELSSGIIDLPMEKTLELIHQLKPEFTVVVEVGKKKHDYSLSFEAWQSCTRSALEAGADYVILEGRNTADTGIFHSDGTLNRYLVDAVLKATDSRRLIFETPTPASQSAVIGLVGANANLGNIFVRDLLLLESQRQALREETFDIR